MLLVFLPLFIGVDPDTQLKRESVILLPLALQPVELRVDRLNYSQPGRSIRDVVLMQAVSDTAHGLMTATSWNNVSSSVISKTQKMVINGDLENAQDVDTVLGNFCFQYLLGFDEAHATALCQAILDLSAHYDVEPVYVNDWNTVPAV